MENKENKYIVKVKRFNICVIVILEIDGRNEIEVIYEVLIVENFLKYIKVIK